jgi:enoyl-CoA hydratase/carnithine racemase
LTRQALFQGLDGTLDHAMTFENFALEKCSRSAEHKEYVSAFIEKRKPDLSRIRR